MMAWFDFAGGLSAMGKTVSEYASTAALEAQKNDLERERIKLSADLAMQRQTQQQGFEMEKLEKTQTFQAGESEKDRAANLERTRISAGASITAAGISAAASRYAADSRIKAAEMEIEALRPGREADTRKKEAEATILEQSASTAADKDKAELERIKAVTESTRADAATKVIAADAKKREEDAKMALSEAMKSGDEERIKQEKTDYAIATMNNSDQVKTAQTAATVAEMYRKELENARNQLTQLEKSTTAMMPDGQEAIAQKRREVQEKERLWRKYANEAQQAFKALPKIETGDEPEQPTGNVIRYDAQGNRIGPDGNPVNSAPTTPRAPRGLIMTVPGGAP